MRTTARHIICLTLVLTAAVAPGAVASGKPVTVTVQGDSLSVLADPFLAPLLPGMQIVSESAQVGRHVADGEKILASQPLGDVVVFALGTNDYLSTASWYTAQIDQVLRLVGSSRCVVVPTVYAYQPASALNRALDKIAQQEGPSRIQIARWAEQVIAGRVQLRDGVHPATVMGARLRAAVIASAVQRCVAALAQSRTGVPIGGAAGPH
jgi:hypothetical protein